MSTSFRRCFIYIYIRVRQKFAFLQFWLFPLPVQATGSSFAIILFSVTVIPDHKKRGQQFFQLTCRSLNPDPGFKQFIHNHFAHFNNLCLKF